MIKKQESRNQVQSHNYILRFRCAEGLKNPLLSNGEDGG